MPIVRRQNLALPCHATARWLAIGLWVLGRSAAPLVAVASECEASRAALPQDALARLRSKQKLAPALRRASGPPASGEVVARSAATEWRTAAWLARAAWMPIARARSGPLTAASAGDQGLALGRPPSGPSAAALAALACSTVPWRVPEAGMPSAPARCRLGPCGCAARTRRAHGKRDRGAHARRCAEAVCSSGRFGARVATASIAAAALPMHHGLAQRRMDAVGKLMLGRSAGHAAESLHSNVRRLARCRVVAPIPLGRCGSRRACRGAVARGTPRLGAVAQRPAARASGSAP
mmetsp:Transcript_69296/g.225765  ORF Transcript_69296/g.225765 Transcript_69296/m.225765 type:complete len:293 (-) Transcript_69296:2072-2950(-)